MRTGEIGTATHTTFPRHGTVIAAGYEPALCRDVRAVLGNPSSGTFSVPSRSQPP